MASRPHPGGSTLQRGDLVEVIGPSGSGKTTLCVFLLMTTLLPASMAVGDVEVAIDGRGKKAAILSPPSHASVKPALRRAMRRHVEDCLQQVAHTAADVESVIEAALANLTVVKPQPRWTSWAVTLRKIACRKDLEMVVCDGFGDGYWVERWEHEERRASNTMRDAWDALTYFRQTVGAVVIVAVQGLKACSPGVQRADGSPILAVTRSRHTSPHPTRQSSTVSGGESHSSSRCWVGSGPSSSLRRRPQLKHFGLDTWARHKSTSASCGYRAGEARLARLGVRGGRL